MKQERCMCFAAFRILQEKIFLTPRVPRRTSTPIRKEGACPRSPSPASLDMEVDVHVLHDTMTSFSCVRAVTVQLYDDQLQAMHVYAAKYGFEDTCSAMRAMLEYAMTEGDRALIFFTPAASCCCGQQTCPH